MLLAISMFACTGAQDLAAAMRLKWTHHFACCWFLPLLANACLRSVEKDAVLRMTAFDGVQAILNPASSDWPTRHEAFFRDYALVPLLVQVRETFLYTSIYVYTCIFLLFIFLIFLHSPLSTRLLAC